MARKTEPEQIVHIRETFEAQLPIVAAILASGQDEIDFHEVAQDAIEICIALEEELG